MYIDNMKYYNKDIDTLLLTDEYYNNTVVRKMYINGYLVPKNAVISMDKYMFTKDSLKDYIHTIINDIWNLCYWSRHGTGVDTDFMIIHKPSRLDKAFAECISLNYSDWDCGSKYGISGSAVCRTACITGNGSILSLFGLMYALESDKIFCVKLGENRYVKINIVNKDRFEILKAKWRMING